MSEEEIPANQRSVRTGGLMRCCLQTLNDDTQLSVVGSTLVCAYETPKDRPQMIVAEDGIWEWNHDMQDGAYY